MFLSATLWNVLMLVYAGCYGALCTSVFIDSFSVFIELLRLYWFLSESIFETLWAGYGQMHDLGLFWYFLRHDLVWSGTLDHALCRFSVFAIVFEIWAYYCHTLPECSSLFGYFFGDFGNGRFELPIMRRLCTPALQSLILWSWKIRIDELLWVWVFKRLLKNAFLLPKTYRIIFTFRVCIVFV